ncbi:MAG: dihydroorotate dehydrogenase electron transfer subunit [Clostridia bacterium]|nr:dihydroorotate dehydrogenase electron transfer subunit [Clostridia bacterium]
MSYQVHSCAILSQREVAPNIYQAWIQNKDLAEQAKPGQFLHIQCGDAVSMPLRRPISICDVQGENLCFIYEVKGRGTKALSENTATLDILGPVGNGFTISPDTYHNPAVVGGGIGVYPMLYLTKQLSGASAYLGFRNKSLVTLEDEFKSAASYLSVSTDDGSYGNHGFALDCLKKDFADKQFDIIYACGPKGMLRAVQAFAKEAGVPCQISLEERMGCGIGACLTCSCETHEEGAGKYKRVCRNGPVFWAEEVVL